MQAQCLIRNPAVAFALGAAVLGCSGAKPVAPKNAGLPFAGTAISISCPDGSARRLLDRHAAAWARLQHVKLTIVPHAASEATDPVADLIVFSPAEMGRLAEAGQLAALPESVTGSTSWAGFLRLYRHKLLLWGSTPYALPLLGDTTLVLFREDAFRAANMQAPGTFAEFVTAAQHLAKARGKPSLPALPADDDGLDREFHTVAAAFAITPAGENELRDRKTNDPATAALFAFHRDVVAAEPRLTDSGFVAALGWLAEVQPLHAKSGTLVSSFAADEAVLGLGTLADLVALKPEANKGRYGVAPIPAGPKGERVPYAGPGGALIAVAKSAKNPAAALALAVYLSDPQPSLEVVHDPSFGAAPYRAAHMSEHRDGWFNYGLDAANTTRLLDALRAATEPRIVNSAFRLRTPDEAVYRKVLLDGIRTALTENQDPASALARIDKRWRELDAATPLEQRRMLYLRSLGLKP